MEGAEARRLIQLAWAWVWRSEEEAEEKEEEEEPVETTVEEERAGRE